MSRDQFPNRDERIRHLYVVEKLSALQIAERFGVSEATISTLLAQLGLRPAPKPRKVKSKAQASPKVRQATAGWYAPKQSKLRPKDFSRYTPQDLIDLRKYQEPQGCRFIIGSVREDVDWRYCQKPRIKGSSYCREHKYRCVQPNKKFNDSKDQ